MIFFESYQVSFKPNNNETTRSAPVRVDTNGIDKRVQKIPTFVTFKPVTQTTKNLNLPQLISPLLYLFNSPKTTIADEATPITGK